MAYHNVGSYDPETIVLLREVLDSAWRSLSPEQRIRTQKSDLALRILRLAHRGERDPVKLRVGAVTAVVFNQDGAAFNGPHIDKRPRAPPVGSGAPKGIARSPR
jgi:hypothetical protein